MRSLTLVLAALGALAAPGAGLAAQLQHGPAGVHRIAIVSHQPPDPCLRRPKHPTAAALCKPARPRSAHH